LIIALFKLDLNLDEMRQAPSQPVEPPDDHGVPLAEAV